MAPSTRRTSTWLPFAHEGPREQKTRKVVGPPEFSLRSNFYFFFFFFFTGGSGLQVLIFKHFVMNHVFGERGGRWLKSLRSDHTLR